MNDALANQYSLDYETETHVLLVSDSGATLHGARYTLDAYHSGYSRNATQAMDCELQPASFFAACLENETSLAGCADPTDDQAPSGLSWFTSCTPAEAKCPAD